MRWSARPLRSSPSSKTKGKRSAFVALLVVQGVPATVFVPESRAAEPRSRGEGPGPLSDLLSGETPLEARLERLTRGLVGVSYVISPLGEGEGIDPDPRFRLDAFDCTTFVETALALLRARRLADVEKELDEIRYESGAPSFEARRHLMTSQWIPGLVAAGYVEDVTRAIAGPRTRAIELRLDARRWAGRRIARALPLPDSRVPVGVFVLPFVPLEDIPALKTRLLPGTIMNLVRVDWARSPEVVTHQALLLRPSGRGLTVRHASPVAKRVVDEPLERVLRRYAKPRKWPIAGLNFLRVVDPGPPGPREPGPREPGGPTARAP